MSVECRIGTGRLIITLSIYLRAPSPDIVVLDTSGREKYVCNRQVKSNDAASRNCKI